MMATRFNFVRYISTYSNCRSSLPTIFSGPSSFPFLANSFLANSFLANNSAYSANSANLAKTKTSALVKLAKPNSTLPVPTTTTTEKEQRLHSSLSNKTFPEKSLLFCHLSSVAYLTPTEIEQMRLIWPEFNDFSIRFLSNAHSEAFIFENQHDVVLACRGTEATSIDDILTDLKIHKVECKTGKGKVHHGFQTYVDNLWPELVHHICSNPEREGKNFWITGHSLGAAMGTVLAKQCLELSDLKTPTALFTFGSPRVGNRIFAEHFDRNIKHFRFVNNGDIVTKVPSGWRFKHCGREWKITRRHDVLAKDANNSAENSAKNHNNNNNLAKNNNTTSVSQPFVSVVDESNFDNKVNTSFLNSLLSRFQRFSLFPVNTSVIDNFHCHSIDNYISNLTFWIKQQQMKK